MAFLVSLFSILLATVATAQDNSTELKPNVTSICDRCICLAHTATVDCANMNFDEIPELRQDMVYNWTFLLNNNRIEGVKIFPNYTKMVSLILRTNMINIIADSAFSNLDGLQSLDLSHNRLTGDSLRPEVFSGEYSRYAEDPIALLELNLSKNKIQLLNDHTFKHLPYLKKLDISENSLGDITLSTARAIAELAALEELNMAYTGLERLPDHFLSAHRNLSKFILTGNKFSTVPSEISYGKSLQHLILDKNIIQILTSDAFGPNLVNLEVLELSHMEALIEVQENAFSNLKALKILKMHHNSQLEMIHRDAFIGLNRRDIQLQELYLQNNHLTTLFEESLPWMNLSLVDLQFNPWHCDCTFVWFGKTFIPYMQRKTNELTVGLICAEPPALRDKSIVETAVQKAEFTCNYPKSYSDSYSVLMIGTIIVGILLFVTGTVVFSFVLFKRTKSSQWEGQNVRYRRANDEERIVES